MKMMPIFDYVVKMSQLDQIDATLSSNSIARRVTRLGEFWPIGRLLNLVSFCKNYRNGSNHWATCFHGKSCVLIFIRNGFGYILGDFSQTHLVTLLRRSKVPGAAKG
jgi:hypothetical protein